MEEGQPSVTAMLTAMFRAAHLLWDDSPKVFEDTLALRLCGCESQAALRAHLDRLDTEVARSSSPDFALSSRRSVTATVVMRGRYLEDEVDQAVRRGVSQYVILGALLTPSPTADRTWGRSCASLEVDHPATQAWKRTRLQEAGVELPINVTLVPVHFEKQSLIDSLQMSGYRTDAPGLFSWLGVPTFLTPDAIFSTLRTIAPLAPGTEIIFQYTVPKELLDEEAQRILARSMTVTAARGEPLRSFFEPAKLEEQVRKLGFAEVSDFGPEEARALYFSGRTDSLRPLASEHLMRAGSARDRNDPA